MDNSALEKSIYNELFEHVPINIAVIDRNYNIVLANRNFENKFGAWQAQKCYAVYKNRKRPCRKCMAALTFEDGQPHVDDELGTDKNGKPARYVLHTAPVTGGDGAIQHVIEMTTDITEIKQLQRNYHVLFERVPCYIAVMDKNFRIVRANEKFRETFGDRIGEKCYKVYKKSEVKCENCPAEKAFKDGKTHRAEQIGITKDGDRNYYVVHAAPLARSGEEFAHVIEISTDLTEIHSLRDRLSRLHDFQEMLIKNSIDAIIGTDEHNRVVLFNPAAERLLGYSAEDVIGKSGLERFLPREFVKVLKSKGETCLLRETSLKTKSKKSVPIRFSGVVLHHNDDILGSAAFLQDLTEIKKLEEAKLESERMAAVGHTVAGLAHGVKNILTGIQGGMYSMKTGMERGDAGRMLNGWNMLERNIDKVTVFVKDFLSFSKGEKPVMELISPQKIARDVVLLYKDAADQAGVKLAAEIQDDIEDVFFDPEGLHVCLANLVSNAIDACLMSEKKECRVVLRAFETDGTVVFEVEDDGVGMDYEIKQKVFTNFFTTKGTKGTGIGLLTTRKIVVQHEGEIAMESESGRGSVFRITFLREKLAAAMKPH